jgi:hypothetical protein
MLARPKSKLPTSSSTQIASKVSKPYSILSMGLLKSSLNIATHRSREIPNMNSSIKTSGEIIKSAISNKNQYSNCSISVVQNSNGSSAVSHNENSPYIFNSLPLLKHPKDHQKILLNS